MMHRFYTPVQIGSKREIIRIVTMQTKDGLRLSPNDFEVYDVIPESASAAPAHAATFSREKNTAPNSGSGTTVTIAEMLRNVKDADGKPYFREFDQQSRGSISFDESLRRALISLTSGANLSTLLHETGHHLSLLHRQTAGMARKALEKHKVG